MTVKTRPGGLERILAHSLPPSLGGLVTSLEGLITSLEGLATSLEGLITSLEELVTSHDGLVTCCSPAQVSNAFSRIDVALQVPELPNTRNPKYKYPKPQIYQTLSTNDYTQNVTLQVPKLPNTRNPKH